MIASKLKQTKMDNAKYINSLKNVSLWLRTYFYNRAAKHTSFSFNIYYPDNVIRIQKCFIDKDQCKRGSYFHAIIVGPFQQRYLYFLSKELVGLELYLLNHIPEFLIRSCQ